MDELQKYYQYLKDNGADVPPTFESFQKTLQDDKSSRQYYDYLRQNQFDTPDSYDSFVNTFGLKKKVSGELSSPTLSPSGFPAPSSVGNKQLRQFEEAQNKVKKLTGQTLDPVDPVSSVKIAVKGTKLPTIPQTQIASTAVAKPIEAQQIDREAEAIRAKDIKSVENYFREDTNNALSALSNATGLSPEALYDDNNEAQIRQSIDPNNQTLQLSFQRLNESKNARKAILQGRDLEDMAANFAASQDPEFKAQYEKLSASGQYEQQNISQILEGAQQQEIKHPARLIFGNATMGRLMYDFITNSAVRQEAAKNPEFEKELRNRAVNLLGTNPEFGKQYLGTIISQKMEDMGINNGIVNVVSKDEADRVIDQLIKEGQISEREKLFYEQKIRPQLGFENFGRAIVGKTAIQTPGLIENILKGGVGTIINTAKGVKDIVGDYTGLRNVLSSESAAISSDLEDKAKRINVRPNGIFHEITQSGGEMFGQSLALGGISKGLNAIKLIASPRVALGIAGGMQAYGNYAPEARMKFPGEKMKQRGYATILSVIEAATENIFRDDKVVEGLVGDFKPFIKRTIDDFTEKNISAAAAGDLISSQFKQFAKKYTTSVSENVIEEWAADVGQQITDGVFEGKPMREWIDGERLLETARSAMIGSTFLSGLAARANMKKSAGAVAKNIYLMAQSPEFWKQQIQDDAKLNPELETEAADKIANLDYVASLLQELEGQNLTDKQKAKYIITSLDSKIKGENMSSKEDPILRERENEKAYADIQANDQIKKDILEGKDDGSIEGDESDKTSSKENAAIKLVNDHIENGLITGIYAEYGQNDPISLLQEISQQAQGIDANGNELPGGGRAEDLMKMGITDELINAAVELYPKQTKPRIRVTADQMEAAQPSSSAPQEALTVEKKPAIPTTELPQNETGGEVRLSHADTKKIYQDHNLPGRLNTPTKSDITLNEEADKLVDDGYDFDKEADKVMSGEKSSFSDAEQVAFGKMVSALQDQQKGLDINDPRFTELQDKIEKYSRASDIVGTLAGRAFRARRSFSERPETLSDYIMEDKKYANSSEQTEQQKETSQREFNEITATENELNDKIAQLTEENKRLKAENELKKISKNRKKSDKNDYSSDRAVLKEQLRKILGDNKDFSIPSEPIGQSKGVSKIIKDGDSVENTLSRISDNFPEYKPLIDALLKKADKDGLNVKIVQWNPNQTAFSAFYNTGDDKIYFNGDFENSPELIIHEIIHALTVLSISNKIHGVGLGGKEYYDHLNKFIKENPNALGTELIKIYLEGVKQRRLQDALFSEDGLANRFEEAEGFFRKNRDDYGYLNIKEFISEAFSNERFQENLNKIKLGGDTLWERIVSAIKKFFNIESKTTLDRVLNEGMKFVEAKRVSKPLYASESNSLVGGNSSAEIIKDIVKTYVEEGIEDLDEIVSKTRAEVSEIIPSITERDIRDIIAGVYNVKKESQSELAAKLHDLKTEQKLLDQIEAIEKGEIPKSERKKRQRNAKLEELRKKIKSYDQKKSSDRNERLKKQIEDIQAKIDAGDYGPDVKPEPIPLDKEGKELHAKLVNLKNERKYRQLREQYENEKASDKAKRVAIGSLNLPRALMATLDFSAVLRQAVIPTISHPIIASKSFIRMFRNAFSKKEYDIWFDNLQKNPRYEGMKKSRLGITDPNNPALEAREEAFMSNLSQYVPILGGKKIKGVPIGIGLIEGSERAYSTYLNKIRVDLYHRFAEQMEKRGLTIENSPEQYKQMAQYINNATGRGDLTTTLNTAAPFLNALFFSPRLIASRVNMLTYFLQLRFYKTVPKEVRLAYLRDMVSFVGVGLAVLGLAKVGGADVEDDPRSSDFGKIKVGNTRWDIWGGFQQYARVVAQIATGERKSTTTGQIQKLDGEGPYGDTKTDVALKFGRGKLAPVPSMVFDLIGGQNIVGEKIVWKADGDKEIGAGEYAAQHLLPLNATGLYEAIQDQGLKALFTVGVPSTFGVGVQTYSDDKKEKTPQEKREEKRKKKEEGPTREEKREERRRKRQRERNQN